MLKGYLFGVCGLSNHELTLLETVGPLGQLRSDARNDVTYPTLESALSEAGLSAKTRLIVLRALRDFEPEPDKNSRLLQFPFLNVFYDLLFDEAPAINQVKDLLNVLIIITGLLSGGATALFSAVSFSDIQAAIYRFSAPWDVSWSFCSNLTSDQMNKLLEPSKSRCLSMMKDDGTFANRYAEYGNGAFTGTWAIGIIEDMPFNTNMSFGCLTSAIFLAVLMYIFITNSEFDKPEFDQEGNLRINAAWWKYARMVIIMIVMLLFIGLYYFAFGYLGLDYIKFPSRKAEMYENFSSRPDAATTGLVSSTNFGYALYAFILTFWLIMSLGLKDKTREIIKLRKGFSRSSSGKITPKESFEYVTVGPNGVSIPPP